MLKELLAIGLVGVVTSVRKCCEGATQTHQLYFYAGLFMAGKGGNGMQMKRRMCLCNALYAPHVDLCHLWCVSGHTLPLISEIIVALLMVFCLVSFSSSYCFEHRTRRIYNTGQYRKYKKKQTTVRLFCIFSLRFIDVS